METSSGGSEMTTIDYGEPLVKKIRSSSPISDVIQRVNCDADVETKVAYDGIGLAELGITQNDLDVTTKTVNAIVAKINSGGTKREELASSFCKYYRENVALRSLRKALGQLVEWQFKIIMFDGKSQEVYTKELERRKQTQRHVNQETHKQRKYLDSTTLRRSRLDKLNMLKDQGRDEEEAKLLANLVPDGPAESNEPLLTFPKYENRVEKALEMLPLDAKGDIFDNTGESNSVSGMAGNISLPKLRSCYVCKQRFRELHHFYDQLCPTCAKLNFEKRNFTQDLTGYVAVVTGARVKIGFQTCLKLLRSGCTVIATTRFPNAACQAYLSQPDAPSFKGRLHVYGLDLRDISGLEAFTRFIKNSYSKIDIIINNACQTIRRPAGYYRPAVVEENRLYKEANDLHKSFLTGGLEFETQTRQMLTNTSKSLSLMNKTNSNSLKLADSTSEDDPTVSGALSIRHNAAAQISQVSASIGENDNKNSDVMIDVAKKPSIYDGVFTESGISRSTMLSQIALLPEDLDFDPRVSVGLVDVNGQQLDLRRHNSWLLKLEDVSTPELVETMFVNAIAPFVLNSRLKPLMLSGGSERPDRFIINVSAMEGKFYRFKTPNHPHTNMAKAALNMMTRTSAEDLAKNCRIYMNSVDTGWINDENPLERAARIAKSNHFQTPIDEIDAAARILDPIFMAVSGREKPAKFGLFYKDYRPTEW